MGFTLPSAAPDPVDRRRIKAIMLAIAALGALVIAGFSHQWFMRHVNTSSPRAELLEEYIRGGFGLVSYHECRLDECEQLWNKQMIDGLDQMKQAGFRDVRASLAFAALGIVALGTLVFGIGGLVTAMLLVAMRRRVKPPPAPTTIAQIALVLSMAAALGMTWTKPRVGDFVVWDIGPAWWIFMGGAIAGIVASRMLGRHLVAHSDVEIAAARQIAR